MFISPAGLVTARFWRHWFDSPQSGNVLGLASIEMRASAGGPNLASDPLQATCSVGGSNPGNVCDNDPSTFWTCPGGQGWIQIDLGSLLTITEIKLVARNDAGFIQAPQNAGIFALDQLGRWVDIDVIGGTGVDAVGMQWSQGETKTLALNADWEDRAVFRWRSSLYITSV